MRGLVLGVLGLTGLYLVTTTGAGRLSTALAVPTGWLAKWADPGQPLIADRSSTGAPAKQPGAAPHPKSGPGRPGPGHQLHH